ncbi:MAG: 3-deoxy-7-phosphoheptulonate synthase [Kiritimatiellia bacterium]
MIIVLKKSATEEQIRHIEEKLREWGLQPNISRGSEKTVIGVIGDQTAIRSRPLEVFPGVESVMTVLKPYKRASREFHEDPTVITIPPVKSGCSPVVIGGRDIVMMAGPCSVESRESLFEISRCAQAGGARIIRAGAFKPRTSPYAFQGLGKKGLEYLAEMRRELGIPIITEVMDTRDVKMVAEYADVIQIGARNMQNFNLLKAVGQIRVPVLIKRGLASTIQELLMSAEYVLSEGNPDVILCERGIRTFEPMTRNTLDLSAVSVIKRESHLPVLVDPSHATGHWDLIPSMSKAAIAAGADGLMLEIHPKPEEALSDGPQALLPDRYMNLMKELKTIAKAVGRSL